ncbi:hypothetical protein OIN60_14860 [Paenibacillus sp. P96]|uniref:Uncharacterized protein n=1 Tax=Paenibacillus zeirhizosphaerae TaxID=2987519 RepID=A0ABT9FTJ2_9BACL|nr:hypothetical protein [Paenibacillus sp. P96]MDP4098038.1 hypothetical protein [Paenibacillus sp. P96]
MEYDLGKGEMAISSESVPLLVELAQRGVISKTDALLQYFLEDVVRQHAGKILFQASHENTALDTLLGWCDEFRERRLRLNANWKSRMLLQRSRADGLCLFNGELRQEEKIAGVLEAYTSANDPEEQRLLSGRIISRLEHMYEYWFEYMKGQPVTVALAFESSASPYKDAFLDHQLEAVMRAALTAMENGWEPRTEIVITNPAEAAGFRMLREWIDTVAEQTLWAYFRSVPYRVGALLSADRASSAAAGELAYHTDLLFIDYTQSFPDHVIKYLLELEDIITSVRSIRPEMEVWVIFSHMEDHMESVFQAGVTGIVCPPSEAALFKLRDAQKILRQNHDK